MWCFDNAVDRSKHPSVDVVCEFMKSCVHLRFRDEAKMQKEIGLQLVSIHTTRACNIKYALKHVIFPTCYPDFFDVVPNPDVKSCKKRKFTGSTEAEAYWRQVGEYTK